MPRLVHCIFNHEQRMNLGVVGLQRSICNELFKATSQITESLSAAITMISDPPAPHMLNQIPEYQEGGAEKQEMEQPGATAATSSHTAGRKTSVGRGGMLGFGPAGVVLA